MPEPFSKLSTQDVRLVDLYVEWGTTTYGGWRNRFGRCDVRLSRSSREACVQELYPQHTSRWEEKHLARQKRSSSESFSRDTHPNAKPLSLPPSFLLPDVWHVLYVNSFQVLLVHWWEKVVMVKAPLLVWWNASMIPQMERYIVSMLSSPKLILNLSIKKDLILIALLA